MEANMTDRPTGHDVVLDQPQWLMDIILQKSLPLLRFETGFLDDLGSERAILLDEAGERLGRAGHRVKPALDEIALEEIRLPAMRAISA